MKEHKARFRARTAAKWAKVDATTDRDIAGQIASDPDTAPEMSTADLQVSRVVRPPALIDVRDLRHRLGLSQAAFARRYGFRTRTVQEWEQKRRTPEGPARILLKLIEQEPEAVERTLHKLG